MPALVRTGWSGLKTKRPRLHLIRVILGWSAQIGIFYAVTQLLFADITTLQFTRPLFVTVLAVFILRENVGWRRWTATLIGFVGVLVVARPGQASFDRASLVAIASSAMFAGTVILIRRLSSTDSPTQILFYYLAGGTVLSASPMFWLWTMPLITDWPLILLIGIFSTGAMVCTVRGFAIGEASMLGPMDYTRLIYAVLIGYFLFAEIPDEWTAVGAVVIIGATLYLARHGGRSGPPAG